MRRKQNGAARSFINAARLHTDKAVFDEIDPSNPVVTAQVVEPRQQGCRRQSFPVDRDRITLGETDRDDGWLIRSFFRRYGALVDVVWRLDVGILKNLALGGRVQQVGINRERRFAALVLRDRNLMLFGECDQILARIEIPFPPGRDDADGWFQSVIAKLETHLVIT